MASFEYRADGHHVDDAGNLITCTYVDFRDPGARRPVTALRKASSERRAIPGCETLRISKPACFSEQGGGLAAARQGHYSTNGWVYCASIEAETPDERAAWRAAMPAGRDAVSRIRRPRAFARALGAMAAEQAGPRGRVVLLRSAVDGRAFCTAHKSQTVYHGPVAYTDDLQGRLAGASSDLELLLLLVFVKDAARRSQREYRFAVWAEREPEEDRLDLAVSHGLLDAMCGERPGPAAGGLVPVGGTEYSAVEDADGDGPSGARPRVEVLPIRAERGNPAVAPRPQDVETAAGEPGEAAARAAIEAMRVAVDRPAAGCRRDAAAAAWHAEAVVRSFCATYGGAVAAVRVNDDSFIVITAEVPGDDVTETTISVGPDGTCACRVGGVDGRLAVAALDPRSFERALRSRMAEAGVQARGGGAGG